MRMDEDAETGARRELKEETGLETSYVEQFGCFSEVNRDPRERVVTIAFYALVRKSEVKGGDDASDAHWFPIDDVPALAFDRDGYRLGYGGGFYDRYLSSYDMFTVGAVYHPFVTEEALPRDSYDVRVDVIATDKETFVP